MTTKLYNQDAYATEFKAMVLACEQVEAEGEIRYQVVLDQTLFFPEEGGQTPDKGMLDAGNVLDVQIENEVITHTTDIPYEVGQCVCGKIDWKHRFFNMQQHSGEHIFSGIVHRKFGYDNVGFHLSDNIVTMDFSGVLSQEEIAEVEWEVNQVIAENVVITVTYPTKEELKNLEYRSKIEIEGQVRIVTIEGVDVCACCAPHVRNTGEIGMLKVMSVQNYKGGVRLSFLCGFRALEAFRQKADIISAISDTLSANQELLPDLVEKLKKSNQDVKYQLAEAKQELMTMKIKEIPESVADILLFENGLETPVVRNAVNEMTEKHAGICGIFVGSDAEGYQYIIGSSSRDCREVATLLREKANARGGGSDKMIQGSVLVSAEEIRKILEIEG